MAAGIVRVVRFVAGGALGIAAGAAVAAALSPERRQAIEERVRARLAEARQAATEAEVRTESELWARFRQLIGVQSPDGLPAPSRPQEEQR